MAFYRCREAFTFTDSSGVPRVVTPGDLVNSDDPDFAKRLSFFEPVEVAASRRAAVETATAAPGEVRSVPRRRRKFDTTPTVTSKEN